MLTLGSRNLDRSERTAWSIWASLMVVALAAVVFRSLIPEWVPLATALGAAAAGLVAVLISVLRSSRSITTWVVSAAVVLLPTAAGFDLGTPLRILLFVGAGVAAWFALNDVTPTSEEPTAPADDDSGWVPSAPARFAGVGHRLVVDALVDAARTNRGVHVVLGPVGSGKTTVLRQFFHQPSTQDRADLRYLNAADLGPSETENTFLSCASW